jgi:hypothetical protein
VQIYIKMVYHRRHYLDKVLEVQIIVLKQRKQGLFYKEIYYKYIENQFHISKRTFDNYLGVNAKKELKELNDGNRL